MCHVRASASIIAALPAAAIPWSRLPFVAIVAVSAGLYVVVLRVVFIGLSDASPRRQASAVPPAGNNLTRTLLSDDDFLNLSIGANNAVIANVDALNAAAMALLALPVAFAVIAADKFKDLCSPWNVLTMMFLAISLVVGFIGYEWGYRLSRRGWKVRDSTEPAQLLGAYIRLGDRAITEAIRENNAVLARNSTVRQQKRTWISFAMLAFVLGAASFVAGRSLCPAAPDCAHPATSVSAHGIIQIECPKK